MGTLISRQIRQVFVRGLISRAFSELVSLNIINEHSEGRIDPLSPDDLCGESMAVEGRCRTAMYVLARAIFAKN